MNKSVPIVVGAIIMIGLFIFVVVQQGMINDHKSQTDVLKEQLTKEQKDSKTYKSQVVHLSAENQDLRDSIAKLNRLILTLKDRLVQKQRAYNILDEKLAKKIKEFDGIKLQIAKLAKQDKDNSRKIANLEKEKAALKKQIESLSIDRVEVLETENKTKDEIVDYQTSKAVFERVSDIVNNTKVHYKSIAVKKDKFGKNLSRLKRSENNWNYTHVTFNMEHSNPKLLLDEQFMFKVFDKDNDIVLTYIESNPMFPMSNLSGRDFKYDGNLVEMLYHNHDKKLGKNYEVHVYYIKDGDEYLLPNSIKTIIQNTKPVKL